ncbi:peptidylprolyl isomerase [Gemmata sp. JC717]|uniref:peptidylprolyl isomerase n=1 Tax=Gemmata algarum TaxID=2975278 RepID=UPI0021BBB1FA|nr:peptidylprolyl isomerase [Gemmata algarum]MDY3551259.1 peptidylprolyl isomerase [Gemmata algarum]
MITRRNPALVSVAACVVLAGAGAWHTPAQPPAEPAPKASAGATAPLPTGKAGAEPVATIFGDVAVTREQFAEHLIRRYGPKELEGFVYRQIISHAFAQKGRTLAAVDAEAALDEVCMASRMNREQLAQAVQRQGFTLAEWNEDVNLPRVMLARMCKAKMAPPTEAELRQAFDVRYGEKLDCRVIIWTNEDEAQKAYEKVRGSEKEFDAHARRSAFAGQQRTGVAADGRVAPIPRAQPLKEEEQVHHAAVKNLQSGDVSPLLRIEPGSFGFMVVKCDRVIPADKTKSFEKEKAALLLETLDAKVLNEFPRFRNELMLQAAPKYHLTFPEREPLPKSDPAKK